MTETSCRTRRKDPSPEEILQECQRIQSTWSEQERMQRLRADMRPYFRRADGVPIEMSEAAYRTHTESREALKLELMEPSERQAEIASCGSVRRGERL